MAQALKLVSEKAGDTLARIATIPLSQWNVTRRNCMTWYWSESEKAALWPSYLGRDSAVILASMYAATESPDPLDRALSVSQKSWLVEDLLMRADKMSMAVSLELRDPFLDYRLVEWANRQPLGAKIGRFEGRTVTKRVLRRFAKGRLPREIIDRPKKGFPVPVSGWLAEKSFGGWARDHLLGPQAKLKHLFQPEEMERQLRQAALGDRQAADRSWALIVLETWFKEYHVDIVADMPS